MKHIEPERAYLLEGIIAAIVFALSIPVAVHHFMRGSLVFSMMMPFMVLSALISTFTLSIHFEGITGRYKKSNILCPKGISIILGINILLLFLVNI